MNFVYALCVFLGSVWWLKRQRVSLFLFLLLFSVKLAGGGGGAAVRGQALGQCCAGTQVSRRYAGLPAAGLD